MVTRVQMKTVNFDGGLIYYPDAIVDMEDNKANYLLGLEDVILNGGALSTAPSVPVRIDNRPGIKFNPLSLFAAGEAGMLFDPTNISTTFQDSSPGTTPAVNHGDPVGRIQDLSPNGFHVVQSIAANRPTIHDVGGIRSILFDASNDDLRAGSSSFGLLRNRTYFTAIVAVLSPSSSERRIFYASVNGVIGTSRFNIGKDATDKASIFARRTDADAATVFASTSGIANVWKVLTGEADYTNTLLSMKINQNAAETFVPTTWGAGTATDDTNSNGVCLGSNNVSTFYFNGRMGRAVYIARKLTAKELEDTIRWCGAGAGLSL